MFDPKLTDPNPENISANDDVRAAYLTLRQALVTDFWSDSRYSDRIISGFFSERWRTRRTDQTRNFMFTGIIEHVGTVKSLNLRSEGGRVTIHAPSIAPHVALANSIAVNGCCLTVAELDVQHFSADLSTETIRKTSMGEWQPGTRVNLEQAITAGKEFGGHFVLGHVDTTGRVTRLDAEGQNWWYGVEVPADFARYIVPQGSIAIDGISLTVARWDGSIAEIAVIPFTYEHTNVRDKKIGHAVNLEGDVLGKYVEHYLEARTAAKSASKLTVNGLIAQGF